VAQPVARREPKASVAEKLTANIIRNARVSKCILTRVTPRVGRGSITVTQASRVESQRLIHWLALLGARWRGMMTLRYVQMPFRLNNPGMVTVLI